MPLRRSIPNSLGPVAAIRTASPFLAVALAGFIVSLSLPRIYAQGRPATPVVVPRHIYSETAVPKVQIAAALAQARSEQKRVLLDFGGDWCGDCQVLEIYFHQSPNAALIDHNFVLVHVWIGYMDKNIDLAARYGVPISKGVPALAVLAPDGKVLYAQQTGQFNDMRHMDSSSVTEFLEKWKS